MKPETRPGKKSAGMGECRLAVLLLAALAGELALFFYFFPYPSGRALLAMLLQCLGVCFFLMLPLSLRGPAQLPPDLPEGAGKLRSFLRGLRTRFLKAWNRLCPRLQAHRLLLSGLLGGLVLLVLHLVYWRAWKPFFQHPVSPAVPVVLGLCFFLLMALELWCAHVVKNLSRSPEEGPWGWVLRTLRGQLRILKFLFLGAAAAAAMPMLGLPALYREYYYFLCVCLGLQGLGFLVLYGIRCAKGELLTRPDLRVLVRHREKGDLNVLGYFRDSTGMTMRSLWSLTLLKNLLPYGFLLCLGLLWLATGLVQIAPNEQGALYRLGALEPEPLEPGLHMTLPRPLDRVDVYDTRTLREITVGYTTDEAKGDNLWTQAHGGDENKLLLGGGSELVSMNLRIEFRIGDLNRYLRCSSAPEALLESAAYEAVTARTVITDLETLLDVDRMAFSRSFEAELTERIARYDTGLEVVDVVIESIHPPIEVAEIYQGIISAGIDAQRILLDARARAEVALAQARTQYDTDVNLALAESHTGIAAANAAVAEFMASLEADGAYGREYRYYKYLDALQDAYEDAALVIVGEGVDSSHLYLGRLPTE